MDIGDVDAAFILGKGGTTKKKIARACQAKIDLHEKDRKVYMSGSAIQRQRAREYLGFVMQQRKGPVEIDLETPRDDMTMICVPADCVAFILGRGGGTLRSLLARAAGSSDFQSELVSQ